MEQHETLAEFVKRIMAEKNLSYRDVSKNSGNLISHSTISDAANGQRFDFRKDTLAALAKGLAVAEDDVFRVARGLSLDRSNKYEFYAETFSAADITPSEWEYLEKYFKSYIQTYRDLKEKVAAELVPKKKD